MGEHPSGEMAVSVVLPCLDEAESVGLCVTEALETLEKAHLTGEVVVVDNGSTDGSREIAAAAGARVVQERIRGYGSALLTGFAEARGEIVVMADADFTYDFSKIPNLVKPLLDNDADLVLGSRLNSATRETMPWLHRYVGTPTLTFLAKRACGARLAGDSQSGYRAFRRDQVETLELSSNGMELASEMLIKAARAGFRIEEIDAGYRPRVGESKLETFSDGWRHLILIVMLAPDLLLIWPGLALLGLGTVMLALGFLSPSGIDVGSLRWQPVFMSGIAFVLGVQALLAGAVLAHYSSVSTSGMQRRFGFVGRSDFPLRCFAAGVSMITAGLAIDVALFAQWLGGDPSSPVHGFGLASLAQSLIIVGSTVGTFGIISRFLRARDARRRAGRRRAARVRRRVISAQGRAAAS